MNIFLEHYLTALLWSSTVETEQDGEPIPADQFTPSEAMVKRCESDCDKFRESLPDDFDEDEQCRQIGDAFAHLAHDFALTRNGHGAGFWDGDWCEPWGTKLTELAQSFGEINLYLSDDNQLEVF